MQLNPKLIQYSLDVKYCQSKIIQDQHRQHLKKLQEIQRKSKSNQSKIKRQTQSLKQFSQSMNRYHQISRTFKSKETQQKRSEQDLKMLKCVSDIYKKKNQVLKVHAQQNQTYAQLKKRKENHNKVIQILKNKQLEEQNIKIGLRIARQQNNFSYVDKIRNEIKEYTKTKKNLLRIKDDSSSHLGKKNANKVKTIKLLSQADQLNIDVHTKAQRRRTQPKIRTQMDQDNENEEFLYEILKKNPSQILNERHLENQEDSNTEKQGVSLPQIKSRSQYSQISCDKL